MTKKNALLEEAKRRDDEAKKPSRWWTITGLVIVVGVAVPWVLPLILAVAKAYR